MRDQSLLTLSLNRSGNRPSVDLPPVASIVCSPPLRQIEIVCAFVLTVWQRQAAKLQIYKTHSPRGEIVSHHTNHEETFHSIRWFRDHPHRKSFRRCGTDNRRIAGNSGYVWQKLQSVRTVSVGRAFFQLWSQRESTIFRFRRRRG